MADLPKLSKYMHKALKIGSSETEVTIERMQAFLQTIKENQIKGFASDEFGGAIWHATLGPNDLLYTPPVYAVGAQVHKQNVYGLSLCMIIKSQDIADRYTWLAENMGKDEQKAKVAKGLADFIAASGSE